MKKTITTKLLKSNMVYLCLRCILTIDRPDAARINFYHSTRGVSRCVAGSFVDCGFKASNLRIASNCIDTAARTWSLKIRSH